MKKLSSLELACHVFWGNYVDSDDCNLTSSDNPENRCIIRDTYEQLTEETKLMLKVIANLPDEMFYTNGKIIIYELNSWMRRRYKWTPKQVAFCRNELHNAFGVDI